MYIAYFIKNTILLDTNLKGHSAQISCLNVSPLEEDRNFLVSGGYDTLIKYWDLR